MPTSRENRRFKAHDASMKLYTVIAERDIPADSAAVARAGLWRFRLEDGSRVSADERRGMYTVVRGDVRLTTTDPQEPKD